MHPQQPATLAKPEIAVLGNLARRIARKKGADPDEAEIVSQDVLMKVDQLWETDTFRRLRANPDDLMAYVSVMARNRHHELCRSNSRRTARERRVGGISNLPLPRPGTLRPDPEPTTPAAAETYEAREVLDRLISQLTPQQEVCFCLRHVDGFTSDEIADKLGLKASTVQTHVREAKQRLRAWLTAEGWAPPRATGN